MCFRVPPEFPRQIHLPLTTWPHFHFTVHITLHHIHDNIFTSTRTTLHPRRIERGRNFAPRHVSVFILILFYLDHMHLQKPACSFHLIFTARLTQLVIQPENSKHILPRLSYISIRIQCKTKFQKSKIKRG